MSFESNRNRNRTRRSPRAHDAWLYRAPCVLAAIMSLPSCSADSGGRPPGTAYPGPPPPATRVMSDADTVNWSADDASSGTGDVVHELIMLPADGIELRATNAGELDRVLAAANTSPSARVELRPRVTDPTAPDDVARAVSRTMEVSAYLVEGGVEPGRIEALPIESNAPRATEDHVPEGYAEHIDVLLHREPVRVSYYWNAWVDPLDSSAAVAAPSYEPVQDLEPGGEYLLSVHLSGLEYNYAGVQRFVVEQRLRETLDDAAAAPTVDELTFQVVLLTDERAFNTPSQVLGDFKVDVDKIRSFMAAGRPSSANPMSELKAVREPDFLFGRLPEVKLQISGARGPTAIGLSFWIEGRPYAEISIPFCVRKRRDDPCPEQVAKTSFGGSGLLDAAGEAGGSAALPDAALHIVELSPSQLVGIFHRADVAGTSGVESHFVWSIKESAEGFTTQLAQLQAQFGRITTAPTPLGKDFKNLLFDGNGTGVQQAKAAFEAFFAAHRGAAPFETADPATIFVRMILQDLPRPWLYPLGLLNVDGQEDGFLGYHLRVETPLPRQSYGQASSCLSNWVPVLPVSNTDPPLQEALVEVDRDARISPSLINPAATTYRVVNGRDPVKPLQNMTELHTWLDQANPWAPSSILSVISHHDRESLYFAAHDTHINPSSVGRQLPGSVAVLSGCSTGQVGSAGIVRALNERGVDSIISTNTGITGRLAGDFVDCLSRAVEDGPPGSEIPVGTAFSKAQRCLYNEGTTEGGQPQSLHGHLVLSFTLAGNPNIPLCGPE